MLRACQAGGRPVAVVGDTCSAAVEAHLVADALLAVPAVTAR
ncbi:hypothetical protein AB0D67_23545 [Streptosporangium sp. NPDC048047]